MKWVYYHKAEVINEEAVCRGTSLPWVSILGALITVVVIDMPVKKSGAEDARGEDEERYWEGIKAAS